MALKTVRSSLKAVLILVNIRVYLVILTGSEHVGGSLVNVSGDLACRGLWLGSVGEVAGAARPPALAGSEHALSLVADHGGD